MSFNDESVVFRMATEAHYPEVLKVLSENFFIDEPMNVCLRKTESRDVNVFSERMRKYLLPKNMTLLAIDKATNEILGVMINGTKTVKLGELATYKKMTEEEKKNMGHVIRILRQLNDDNLHIYHEEFPNETLFELCILTIDKNKRKNGLGRELIRRSVMLADVLGFKACVAEASGHYSRLALAANGFEVRGEILYKDYTVEEGNKPFALMDEPHKSLTLMIKKLR